MVSLLEFARVFVCLVGSLRDCLLVSLVSCLRFYHIVYVRAHLSCQFKCFGTKLWATEKFKVLEASKVPKAFDDVAQK